MPYHNDPDEPPSLAASSPPSSSSSSTSSSTSRKNISRSTTTMGGTTSTSSSSLSLGENSFEGSTGSNSTSSTTSSRRQRASHPWRIDLQVQRRGSTSTTTTTSTAGGGGGSVIGRGNSSSSSSSSSSRRKLRTWKQRMQERKAVYGNITLPEQGDDDEDEGDKDEYDESINRSPAKPFDEEAFDHAEDENETETSFTEEESVGDEVPENKNKDSLPPQQQHQQDQQQHQQQQRQPSSRSSRDTSIRNLSFQDDRVNLAFEASNAFRSTTSTSTTTTTTATGPCEDTSSPLMIFSKAGYLKVRQSILSPEPIVSDDDDKEEEEEEEVTPTISTRFRLPSTAPVEQERLTTPLEEQEQQQQQQQPQPQPQPQQPTRSFTTARQEDEEEEKVENPTPRVGATTTTSSFTTTRQEEKEEGKGGILTPRAGATTSSLDVDVDVNVNVVEAEKEEDINHEKVAYLLASFRKSLVLADLAEQLKPLHNSRRHSIEAMGRGSCRVDAPHFLASSSSSRLGRRRNTILSCEAIHKKAVMKQLNARVSTLSTKHHSVVESGSSTTSSSSSPLLPPTPTPPTEVTHATTAAASAATTTATTPVLATAGMADHQDDAGDTNMHVLPVLAAAPVEEPFPVQKDDPTLPMVANTTNSMVDEDADPAASAVVDKRQNDTSIRTTTPVATADTCFSSPSPALRISTSVDAPVSDQSSRSSVVDMDQMRKSFMAFGIDLGISGDILSPRRSSTSDSNYGTSPAAAGVVRALPTLPKLPTLLSLPTLPKLPTLQHQHQDDNDNMSVWSEYTIDDDDDDDSEDQQHQAASHHPADVSVWSEYTIDQEDESDDDVVGTTPTRLVNDKDPKASTTTTTKDSTKNFQEQMRKSFMAFEALVGAQKEMEIDDDEQSVWTEFTTEELTVLTQTVVAEQQQQQQPTQSAIAVTPDTVAVAVDDKKKVNANNLQEEMRKSFMAFEALVGKKKEKKTQQQVQEDGIGPLSNTAIHATEPAISTKAKSTTNPDESNVNVLVPEIKAKVIVEDKAIVSDGMQGLRKATLQVQMAKSFQAFEALLGAKQRETQNNDDDAADVKDEDDWTEYTINETIQDDEDLPMIGKQEQEKERTLQDRVASNGSLSKNSSNSPDNHGEAFYDCHTGSAAPSEEAPPSRVSYPATKDTHSTALHYTGEAFIDSFEQEEEEEDCQAEFVEDSTKRMIAAIAFENSFGEEEEQEGHSKVVVEESAIKLRGYQRFFAAFGQGSRPQEPEKVQQPEDTDVLKHDERTHDDELSKEITNSERLQEECHQPIKGNAVVSTTSLMKGRMFSDTGLTVEEVMDGPYISFVPDDDDMTQLTFDQSYHFGVAPVSPNPVSDDGSAEASRASESSKRIAEILRRDVWSRDKQVVQAALEKLRQEASNGSQQRTNITRFGGLLAILRAMEVNSDIVPIQITACKALENMALDSASRMSIGEVDGIPSIVGCMNAHMGNLQVQQAACSALQSISRCCRRYDGHGSLEDDEFDHNYQHSSYNTAPIAADGAVQALVTAMMQHANDVAVQSKAFGALGNICVDHPERLQELSDSGGLATMTMALQKPWESKMEKHEAISTLSILLRCLAEQEHQ